MTTGNEGDPLLGQLVGDFRVERQLGRGGMGAVYVMRHVTHPNTRKVLKVMLKEHTNNAFLRSRFRAEADALSQLGDHACIVGMENFTTLADGQLAIVMQFCEGAPLETYVLAHGGKLAPHRAFYAAAHIARALHHAHSRGIVHRDLKPPNVFVEDDDNDVMRCRLLDFGVARRLNPNPTMPSNTVAGPIGTPDFMAPEQQDRAAEATAAADVFSLAVMLWWMVTGGLPWGRQVDPAILYQRKLHDLPDPPLVDTFPLGWEDSLRAALRPYPAARPSLRQLMQALAVGLPGIGRGVLSGAEILQRYCRALCDESLPDDVTLRNNSQRTLVPAWPEREPAARVPSSNPTASSLALELAERSSQPPPASATGASPTAAMMTTLGASTGMVVSTPPMATRPQAWKLAAVGVSLALAAGAATFAIAVRGRGGSVEPATTPTAPTPTATRSAATAPVTSAPTTSAPTTSAPTTSAPATTAPTRTRAGGFSTPPTPKRRAATALPRTEGAPATQDQTKEHKLDPDAVIGQ